MTPKLQSNAAMIISKVFPSYPNTQPCDVTANSAYRKFSKFFAAQGKRLLRIRTVGEDERGFLECLCVKDQPCCHESDDGALFETNDT